MPKYKKTNFKLLFAYVLAKMIHKMAERSLVIRLIPREKGMRDA